MVNQNYLNKEKEKQQEEQYEKDLVELSMALPEKGTFLEKIGVALGLLMDRVLYDGSDRSYIHQKAESMRHIRKSLVEDL